MPKVFGHYVPAISIALVVGDVAMILLSFYVARLSGAWIGGGSPVAHVGSVVLITAFILRLGGLYSPRPLAGRHAVVARLLTCQAAAGLFIAAIGIVLPSLRLGGAAFVTVLGGTTLGLIIWRTAWRFTGISRQANRSPEKGVNTL